MNTIKRTHTPQNSMDAILKNLFSDDFLRWPEIAQTTRSNQDNFVPVNILEQENAFTVDLAAPGMKKTDFKIDLDNNKMVVSADLDSTSEEKTENFLKKEFGSKGFRKSFVLPEKGIDVEGIKAAYENGVLSISVPKMKRSEEKAVKEIKIS